MELLTQNLPSGESYSFPSIHLEPMKFSEILEYLENVPDNKKNPVEHYYFNYCLVKDEDPNIDNLLLIDMEYAIYMKKAMTISDNLTFNSRCNCPNCGEPLHYEVSLAGIEWNHMDTEARNGLSIMFAGSMQNVRMPKVSEFMDIFKKYRLYKKVSDMRIIKLIALFEQSMMYLQRIETQVINATYKDISALFMLDSIYYNFVKPKQLICNKCAMIYQPTDAEIYDEKVQNNIKPEDELPDELMQEIKSKHGRVDIGMETLVSEFFRDISDNNRLTSEEILSREVRQNAEH